MNSAEAFPFLNNAKSGLHGKAIFLLLIFCLSPLLVFLKMLLNFIFEKLETHDINDVNLFKNFLFYALCTILLLSCVKYFHKLSPTQWALGSKSFSYKLFFLSFLIYGLLLYGSSLIQAKLFSETTQIVLFQINNLGIMVGVSVLCLVFFEELLFRAYFLQQFYILFKDLRLSFICTAILFASIHYSADGLSTYGPFFVFTYYFLVSLILSIFTVLSDGLAVPLGIHFANNYFLTLLPPNYLTTGVQYEESQNAILLISFIEFLLCATILYWILLHAKLISNIKKLSIPF